MSQSIADRKPLTLRFLVVIWVAGVLGMATVFFFLIDVPRLLRLRQNPAVTEGRVVATDRFNHMSGTIEYSVGDSRLRRSFGGVEGSVGSWITIYYDLRDPNNASIREPQSFVKHEIHSAIAACLVCGTGLVMAALLWQRKKLDSRSAAHDLRMMLVLASIGAAGGFLVRLQSRGVHGPAIVESAMVLSGDALALVAAFRAPDERRWRDIFRSRMMITGGVLVVGGLVLQILE